MLHAFEEMTRTGTAVLIQAYLDRCDQEPGEIEGLLTTGSSGETSSPSSGADESESNEDEVDDDEVEDSEE